MALSCSKQDGLAEYGYVQFRMYKEASYQQPTKANVVTSQLEYLSQAHKVRVLMKYKGEELSQTLVITPADELSSEWGLKSEKLKLLVGTYSVEGFILFDSLDNELYYGVSDDFTFNVVGGGLQPVDLCVNVQPRGYVRFTFTKDMSAFTKAASRQYTFDEIRYVDLTIANTSTGERFTWEKLKTKFSVEFAGSPDKPSGYQTSILSTADSLSVKGGDYKVVSYRTYDSDKILLETNNSPAPSNFSISDNAVCKADVALALYPADEYIKDYYALKEIWEALDGPNWFFSGQDFSRGSNWDFNKDVDLWGDQPGVQLYSNGRVAMINLEGYNFRGAIPDAIGQLTELDQLYLGNHNDVSFIPQQPLIETHKMRMRSLHTPTPMSEPVARALKENGIVIPETAIYETLPEREVIDQLSGRVLGSNKRLLDNPHGVYSNGLTAISPAIGKLKKLEYLYIANSPIKSLPAEMSQLESLSDLEIYNCPDMKEFPLCIANMPSLISVNLSNNLQWSPAEILKGVKALANGPSARKIQILYLAENNLEELPEDVANFKAMGLFDATANRIRKVAPFGHDVNLVDCYLDHNQLEDLGRDELGYFCGIEDVETFSCTFNKFKQFPNIFNSKSLYVMASVDFSYNQIESFEGEAEGTSRGLNVATLTLANNPIKVFPTIFATTGSIVSYVNMRGCLLETIPEEAFKDENMVNLTSLDLSYNHLSELPEKSFNSVFLPYMYGVDISYNRFTSFPWCVLDSAYLTVLALRGQRTEDGLRCYREWPEGIYQHRGLRGLYLGSNDLRKVSDTISTLIYYLDISDNPNITFDASDICYAWRTGSYILIYDDNQDIVNCDYMIQ